VFSFISDGQTLLFILVLLYLTECLVWVKKQSVAFVSPFGRRWRLATPKSWLGNANGALLFLNPLPPPGQIVLSHLLPVSISPRGVCAFNSQVLPSGSRPATQTGEFVAFSAISKAGTDGVYLLLNGEKFAKCATPKQAKALASLITSAAEAKASRRESIARSWIAKQFDAREAEKIWREAQEEIGSVQGLCTILFLFLFVAMPTLVTIFGLQGLIIPIGAVMIALAVLIGIVFFRSHRKFFPAESQERFENLVKMILCPPVSMRAADILTRSLLSEYSPLVVASVLAGSANEQQFVRAFVLDLKHPLKHEVTEASAVETIDWATAEQLKASLAHVERAGDRIVFDQTEREGDSIAYCPRCGVQFVVSEGECPDCPGVDLVSFAAKPERSASSGSSAH
jgi:hypothetical protein